MFSQGKQKYIVKFRIIYYCESKYNNWGNLFSSLTFSSGIATVKFTNLVLLSRVMKFTVTSISHHVRLFNLKTCGAFSHQPAMISNYLL